MAGKPWYNNGIKEIQLYDFEVIPEGYMKGRLPKTKVAIDNWKKSYNSKTKKEKDIINKKRSDTLKNTFANKTYEEKQKTITKRRITMENKTEEEKFNYKHNISLSLIGKNKDKEPWNKGLTKETDDRILVGSRHTSETNKMKALELKIINPNYYLDWRKKVSDKMRINNSWVKSKDEESYYINLCEKFGKENVLRQYTCEKYPFACDFYITSQELFIELNKNWTHGGRPFDPNDLFCQEQLKLWQDKSKTSDYYKNAIYTWTDLDVRKQQIAKENNLNYKAIY